MFTVTIGIVAAIWVNYSKSSYNARIGGNIRCPVRTTMSSRPPGGVDSELMESPDVAVEQLVARVFSRVADAREPGAIRAAFAAVLCELDVRLGDPAWTDGRDVIGAAYERVLHGRDRRALGQFFTPLSIGRSRAAWLLADEPRLLLDPACGSGSLLAAAAHERTGTTTFVGIDVHSLAITMTSANATLRGVAELELHARNFLLDDVEERPDAVICNPPFTRHQELSREEKLAIHAGFKRRLGLQISQLASLHVLFLDSCARDLGRGCAARLHHTRTLAR